MAAHAKYFFLASLKSLRSREHWANEHGRSSSFFALFNVPSTGESGRYGQWLRSSRSLPLTDRCRELSAENNVSLDERV